MENYLFIVCRNMENYLFILCRNMENYLFIFSKFSPYLLLWSEPRQDKTNKMTVPPAKT